MSGARSWTTRLAPRGGSKVWEAVEAIEGSCGIRARIYRRGETLRVDVELTAPVSLLARYEPDRGADLDALRTWARAWMAGYAVALERVTRRRRA